MKRGLVILLCLFTQTVFGQSTIEVNATGAGGFDGNIYNSPDSYINLQGDTLGADTLIQRELFREFGAALIFKWRKDGHYLKWDTEGELRRYQTQKSADAEEIQSRLSYAHTSSNKVKKGGMIRLRAQNRLGTNVLGSELLTPFSFRQVQARGFIEKKTKKKHVSGAEITYNYKNYDVCFGCDLRNQDVSLTQRQWELTLYQEWIVGENQGEEQKLGLSARFSDRQYQDWLNYDVLNPNRTPDDPSPFLPVDPDREYTPRKWRYMIYKADYTFPLSKVAKIAPYIEFTRRYDVSNGDFGFIQWQPGARFYVRQERWQVRASASYTSRDYTDRLAQQQEGTPFPTLEYRYIRASAMVRYDVGSGFGVFAQGAMNNRDSNTSEVTTRVRRSYEAYEVLVGLNWNIERKRGGKSKD